MTSEGSPGQTEKRWVVYNRPNDELSWFDKKEIAERFIRDLIVRECDEAIESGFSDEAEDYWLFRVEGKAKLIRLRERKDQIIDSEGYDQNGNHWGDGIDTYYTLKYIPEVTDRQELIRKTYGHAFNQCNANQFAPQLKISFEGAVTRLKNTKGIESFGIDEAVRFHKIARDAWLNGDFEKVAEYFSVLV